MLILSLVAFFPLCIIFITTLTEKK
jgi:hypothetical protein